MGVGVDGDSDSQSVDYGNPGRAVVLGCIGGLCLWFLVWATAIAGDLYVSPTGSNGNAGTEASPWATVAYAATQAQAGDTVWIKAGTYPGNVTVANSGVLGAPIVFRAYPGDERLAVISGGKLTIKGSKSYIQVLNLKFLNSPERGINIEGPDDYTQPPVSWITVAGNHFYNTFSSGVSVWGVPWGGETNNPGDYDNATDITIEGNLFELCVNGGWNECITVANGAKRIVVRNNVMQTAGNKINGGEGIDFKEGVTDSTIRGNYINAISRRAIYIDGGSTAGAVTGNIKVIGNTTVNDPGDSIAVMNEGAGAVDGVIIASNLVVSPRQNGISLWKHTKSTGPINDIRVLGNTVINGGNDPNPWWGGISMKMPNATNIAVHNNIVQQGKGFDIAINAASWTASNNLCRNTAYCDTNADPQFVNPTLDPATWNYRLLSTSPAWDTGIPRSDLTVDLDGNIRPQCNAQDRGAYEIICASGGCHATL